jgi:ABC-type multidrug transport system ATPase subunit
MTGRSSAIQAKGLSKTFGHRVVLRPLDLEVAEGESVALAGANGAGKTTLLRCLSAVMRPSTGEVRWFGCPAAGNIQARRLLGMVAHECFLYGHLTVRENLVFAARMHDVPQPAQRADDLIGSIGLGRHAQRLSARLSPGMRQRVAVARALVHDPRILVLDEPFAGLDAEGTDWLVGLLQELRGRGLALCFATHDEEKMHCLADRILRLRDGRLQEVTVRGGEVSAGHLPTARAA